MLRNIFNDQIAEEQKEEEIDIPRHDVFDKQGIDWANHDDLPSDTKRNVSAIPHGVDIVAQLNDGNELMDILDTYFQKISEEQDVGPSSDQPHPLHTWIPSWAKDSRKVTLGFFASGTYHGLPDESGDVDMDKKYHLQMYDDIESGTQGIANLASKSTVVIERRSKEHTTRNHNKPHWKSSTDGEMMEGSEVKLQGSYIMGWEDAITRIREIFTVAFGEEFAQSHLGDRNINEKTIHNSGPEVHKRFDADFLTRAVETLRDSADLIVSGDDRGSGREAGMWTEGKYSVYKFESDYFEALGLRSPPDSQGAKLVEEVEVKVYMFQNAEDLPEDHPLAQPKIEAKARGKFYWKDWKAVEDYLTQIVNTHCYHAGIEDSHLVEDDWFKPDDREKVDWELPRGRGAQLKRYWRSAQVRRAVEQRLFESNTDSYFLTVLGVLDRGGYVTLSRLSDYTGLTKSGVSRAIRKLVSDNILTRENHGKTFVKFAPGPAKKKVSQWIKKIGSTQRELEQKRKEIRDKNIESREQRAPDDTTDSTETTRQTEPKQSRPTDSTETTRQTEPKQSGQPSPWIRPLSKLPVTMTDVVDDYTAGVLADDDIYLNTRVHKAYRYR